MSLELFELTDCFRSSDIYKYTENKKVGEDNWSHPSPHVLPQNMDVKTEGKEGPTTYLLASGRI